MTIHNATPARTEPGSLEALDKLTGYGGWMWGTQIEEALDEQRKAL